MKRTVCIFLLLLIGVLAACDGTQTPAATPSETPSGAPDAATGYTLPGEDVLSLAIESPIRTAHPHMEQNALLEGIGEGLLRAHEGGYRPGIADTYTANEEKTIWTFTLRKDAAWSDGTPITAGDFVMSWRLLASTGGMMADALSMVEGYPAIAEAVGKGESPEGMEPLLSGLGVEALDEYTLQVRLHTPCPWFLQRVAGQALYPIHGGLYEQYGAQYGTSLESTACNGPFILTEWPSEGDIVLSANPDYWDASSIGLSGVWLRTIEDSAEREAAFMSGAVHATRVDGDVDVALAPLCVQVTGGEIGVLLANRMRLDTDGAIRNEEISGTLSNNGITNAISAAIDRTALAALGDSLTPAAYLIPGSIAANDPLGQLFGAMRLQQEVQSPHPLTGDPAAAVNSLLFALEATGYAQPEELPAYPMIASDDAQSMAIAAEIAKSVHDTLGITIEIVPVSAQERDRAALAGEYDLLLSTIPSPVNDALPLLSLFGENELYRGGWQLSDSASHSFYQSMLESAAATPEGDIRAAQLIDAEGFLLTFGPVVPLYTRDHSMLRANTVSGVNGRAFGEFYEYCYAHILR